MTERKSWRCPGTASRIRHRAAVELLTGRPLNLFHMNLAFAGSTRVVLLFANARHLELGKLHIQRVQPLAFNRHVVMDEREGEVLSAPLHRLQQPTTDSETRAILEKLVTRTMFGIINAARNSA